jgi:methanogenic corrinoid protein MtbC1
MRQQLAAQECWTEIEGLRLSGGDGSLARASTALPTVIDRRRTLTRTVEQDVIPQLLLRARGARATPPPAAETRPVPPPWLATEADVRALTDLVLVRDQREAAAFVAELREQGAQADALCLDLLSPAARLLGEFWEQDICHFSEVTVGLVRLQHVLRELSPAPSGLARPARARPHALLVPLPGEQHSFGLAMVVEFFRRAGWSVWTGRLDSRADLGRMVAGQWFGMVGVSSACGQDVEPVLQAVRQIRQLSRNRDVAVMVGGPAFIADPQLAGLVGADATAMDGRQAVLTAEGLLAVRADPER